MPKSSKWGKFNDSVDLKGLREDIKNADPSKPDYPEVPAGDYEVELASLEMRATKREGKPMVSMSFKILTGEYKGQHLFDNKVIYGTKNTAQSIKQVEGFLDTLESGIEISFHDYDQFDEVVMDVFEAVEGKVEYVVEYDPDEFFRISVKEAFDVDAA